jgi:hypothetical protein
VVPVASFPHERWALEVEEGLRGAGISATVDPRGSRAYQVVVPEGEAGAAAALLSEMGYMTCPVGGPSLGAGVKDWAPEGGPHMEALEAAKKETDEFLRSQAKRQAAEAWSTPPEDLPDEYEEAWVVATFGDWTAVNGNAVSPVPPAPRGYELTNLGGGIPVVEEYVEPGGFFAYAARKQAKRFPDVSAEWIETSLFAEYGTSDVPVSVSGHSEVYARPARPKKR